MSPPPKSRLFSLKKPFHGGTNYGGGGGGGGLHRAQLSDHARREEKFHKSIY